MHRYKCSRGMMWMKEAEHWSDCKLEGSHGATLDNAVSQKLIESVCAHTIQHRCACALSVYSLVSMHAHCDLSTTNAQRPHTLTTYSVPVHTHSAITQCYAKTVHFIHCISGIETQCSNHIVMHRRIKQILCAKISWLVHGDRMECLRKFRLFSGILNRMSSLP